MEIFALFAYVAIGILAGLIGGLLGLSGGVVTVPCLVFVFHFLGFPQDVLMHTAIGTSLSAMVLTGIASTWAHHRHKGVMWDIIMLLIPGIIGGCLLGAFVSNFLSGIILRVIFGVFIGSLGIYVLLQKKKTQPGKRPHKTIYSLLGLGIGFLASLLGIGGGVFMVPLLISHRFSEKKSIGTSAASGLLISFMGSLAYLYFGLKEVRVAESIGYIYLPAFALIGLGTVFFAPLGVKWAHRMDPTMLRKIFAATIILVGILMIFK